MRLSDLQDKDIINIVDGKKIGNIIDIRINSFDGKIKGLIIEEKGIFNNMFKGNTDKEILWNQINKIGEDVIIVKVDK